jgi:hypothetical protein
MFRAENGPPARRGRGEGGWAVWRGANGGRKQGVRSTPCSPTARKAAASRTHSKSADTTIKCPCGIGVPADRLRGSANYRNHAALHLCE